MGTVYIFRGIAGTGKSTLSNMLARHLSIPVIRKDDIVDALKSTPDIDSSAINNALCYNILRGIAQTNLDLGADFILDIALGDRQNAKHFIDRLDLKENRAGCFLVVCSDENEFKRRHLARISNPLPHQVFTSYEHVLEHYKNADGAPLPGEYVIDTAAAPKESFGEVLRIAGLSVGQ